MDKVSPTPLLPRSSANSGNRSVDLFLTDLIRALFSELQRIATRLNGTVTTDGADAMAYPLKVASYTVATLPTASDWTAGVIAVSNEAGGYTLAFSDGTDWRRVQDRAVVS